jgi:ribosomal protein S18 acetylase RimI-like enzyme
VIQVDYADQCQATDLVALLDHYARGSEGGGKPLPARTLDELPRHLAALPHAVSLLAYEGGRAVGLLNGFEGFSTFRCRPLLNIHDLVVIDSHRGRGIAQALLKGAEDLARQRDCCKLTLEVLAGNHRAKEAYHRFGFQGYELDPALGQALFMEKTL